MALSLKARRYYRFFPAIIALEERCLRTGYQVEENLKRFCEEILPKSSDGIIKFYEDISKYAYRLRDWNYDFLVDMDIPAFDAACPDGWNSNPRPKREWDEEPWEDEVQAICGEKDPAIREERYLQYERRQQRLYVIKAREFELA